MTRCVRVRVCDTVDVRLRLGLPTRSVSSAPVCTGVAPAKRPRALNTLTSHHMASGSSAEYIRRVAADWQAIGVTEHLDADNLLLLTEPYWALFYCDAKGTPVHLSAVDKIRLKSKLITRTNATQVRAVRVPRLHSMGLMSRD